MKKRVMKKRLKEEQYNQLLSLLPVEQQKELYEGKHVLACAEAQLTQEGERVLDGLVLQMYFSQKHVLIFWTPHKPINISQK